MNIQTVKIQMPVDMARARKDGTMWTDHAEKPRTLLKTKHGKFWTVEQEDIWDRMLTLCEGKGSMRSYFKAYYDKAAGKWVLVEEVNDEAW